MRKGTKFDQMVVKFLQAECGDACRIQYLGEDKKFHNVLIDSGYERTFNSVLKSELEEIQGSGQIIDLWIISHIHSDHIGGAVNYIKRIRDGENTDLVKEWMYNFAHVDGVGTRASVSSPASISQANKFEEYLSSIANVNGPAITSELYSLNYFGLKVNVLSPDTRSLAKLREKSSLKALEAVEQNSISLTAGSRQNDYRTKVFDFDIDDELSDTSIENGSSIAVLTEIEGSRILWLADAHPEVVVASLKKLGYTREVPLRCDWVKISHHGSTANNSNRLYDLISCSRYLISSNGENIYNLPEKACLSKILRNRNRNKNMKYEFYFTHDDSVLRNIFDVDGNQVFERLNFSMHFPSMDKMIKWSL